MSRIRGTDTGPEMAVRRIVHGMGFRYKLHARALPGTPDLVFPKLGKIIFVHGCFWHQHPGCGRQPKSRLDFWKPKLFQNRERDLRNRRKLRSLGWRILIVWECTYQRACNHEVKASMTSHGSSINSTSAKPRQKESAAASAYIAQARRQFSVGTSDLEIDDDPEVSIAKNGAWIAAWVWVTQEEARLPKKRTPHRAVV